MDFVPQVVILNISVPPFSKDLGFTEQNYVPGYIVEIVFKVFKGTQQQALGVYLAKSLPT